MKKTEVEIKLRIEEGTDPVAATIGLGAHLVHPRELEDNQLYDFPDFSLKTRGAMLRVRLQGRGSTLTYKEGSRVENGVKVREEMEVPLGATGVEAGEMTAAILLKLGMRPLFRYQKYRTVYDLAGLIVTIDETPIGTYFELEGPKPLIDDAATRLGYKASDYIVKSYFALHQEYLKARGLPLKDMLFDAA